METTNVYEERARQVKVGRLAEAVFWFRDGQGFTADELEQFTPEQREMMADIADVRVPSDETWALLVSSVRVRQQRVKDVDDLFDGLAR